MAMKRKRGSRRAAPRKKMRTVGLRRAPKKYKRTSTTSYTRSSAMPVADSFFTKLHYYQQLFTAVPVSAGITACAMYQTSLFDPDASSGGHQPMWFDQLCPQQYTSYRVYGFRYNIVVSAKSAEQMWSVYIRHANTTVLDTIPQNAAERAGTRLQHGTPLNGNKTMVRFSGFLSLAKVRGISKERVRNDPEFEGRFDVNPPAMGYLHIGIYQPSGIAQSFDIATKLTYLVKFTGRVTPSGS